jgi:hypothetical protein
MLRQLRGRCFRTLPDRIAAAGLSTTPLLAVTPVAAEPGAEAFLTVPAEPQPADSPGLLLVLNEEEDPGKGVPEWARPLARGRQVHILCPRGGGPLRWTRKSPPNYVERAHALLGRTVDQGRVWDVAAVARLLAMAGDGKRDWVVAGRGRAGILAAYAALFDPSIQQVVCVDPPASHRDGPYFLGVLRVLDIPEALGMLAPRRVTLVGAKDKAFDRTASLFEAAGAADRLRRQ